MSLQLKQVAERALLERRTKVADLVYRHKTAHEISIALEISLVSVKADIEWLKNEWRQKRERSAEDHFDEQLARLDQAEAAIWDRVMSGYAPALQRWLDLMDQRNKLLGLYAPTKSEMDIGEQLASLITKINEDPPELPIPTYKELPAPAIDGEFTEEEAPTS